RAAAAQVGEPSADAVAGEIPDDCAAPGRLFVADDRTGFEDGREQVDLRYDLAGLRVAQHLLVADHMALVVLEHLLAQWPARAHRTVVAHRRATAENQSRRENH